MTTDALQLSLQYLQQGEPDRAEETLRNLLRGEEGNVQGLCLLGRIRQARGRSDEALVLFQQAAQLDPHSADAHNLTGSALVRLRQPDRALACLEEALRLDPFHAEAYNNLGKVHLLRQRPNEALVCFREAVRLQPGNVDMLNNLALALIGRRQFDEARPLLELVVQIVPNFTGGWVSLSRLYFEQGDLEQALSAAQKAVQLDPRQADALDIVGAVLLKRERHEEALGPLQAAVQIAPQHALAPISHQPSRMTGDGDQMANGTRLDGPWLSRDADSPAIGGRFCPPSSLPVPRPPPLLLTRRTPNAGRGPTALFSDSTPSTKTINGRSLGHAQRR